MSFFFFYPTFSDNGVVTIGSGDPRQMSEYPIPHLPMESNIIPTS
jgi:hypothetical protein